jgi:hypothetical protein
MYVAPAAIEKINVYLEKDRTWVSQQEDDDAPVGTRKINVSIEKDRTCPNRKTTLLLEADRTCPNRTISRKFTKLFTL